MTKAEKKLLILILKYAFIYCILYSFLVELIKIISNCFNIL